MTRDVDTVFKTTADKVRTGHVITTPYAQHGQRWEVAWSIRERFVNPEGLNTPVVIRWAGWKLNHDGSRGQWRDVWGGQRPDDRVYVLDDRRDTGDAYGAIRWQPS